MLNGLTRRNPTNSGSKFSLRRCRISDTLPRHPTIAPGYRRVASASQADKVVDRDERSGERQHRRRSVREPLISGPGEVYRDADEQQEDRELQRHDPEASQRVRRRTYQRVGLPDTRVEEHPRDGRDDVAHPVGGGRREPRHPEAVLVPLEVGPLELPQRPQVILVSPWPIDSATS